MSTETTPAELLTPPPAETPKRDCRECGRPFELPPYTLAAKFVHVCPACSERRAEADQCAAITRAIAARESDWARICPKEFQNTEAHKLPSPTKLQRVLQWQYGKRGLVLHGPTRRGKSRCAWKLMEREHKAGRRISVLDCGFSYDYAARYSVNAAEASRYLDAKMRVELLLLDDIFKAKFTDSSEQALFVVFNYRFENGLPCVVTTNDAGDTLKARMTEDRGNPMIERLREFCDSISF